MPPQSHTRVRYQFDNGWSLQLNGTNLARNAYGSLLKTDTLYYQCNGLAGPVAPLAVCQSGVMDRVCKSIEPLQPRLTLICKSELAGSFAIIRHAGHGCGDVSLHDHCRGGAFPPSLRPGGHEAAMPHPPLGDDMLCEMIDLAGVSAQQRNFHAAGMVEMNLHGGD